MDSFDIEAWLEKNVRIAFDLMGVEGFTVKLVFNYDEPEKMPKAYGQFHEEKNTIEFYIKNIQSMEPLRPFAAFVAMHEARHVYQYICKRLFLAGIAPEDYREYRRLKDADTGSYPDNDEGENALLNVMRPRELDASAFAGKAVMTLYDCNLQILSVEQKEKMLPYLEIFNRYFKEKAEKLKAEGL